MPAIKCSNGHRTQVPTSLVECPICGEPFILPGSSSSRPLPAPTAYSPPVPTPRSPVPMPSSTSIFGPLPSNLPSRPPDLEGTVAIPPIVSEIQLPSDWSTTALGCFFIPFALVFRPLMAIMGLMASGGRMQRKMTINTVRIRCSDGTFRDCRFEGDLMGGGISQGDTLSIWGSGRGGVLIAQRAYNHTTHSVITLNQHAPLITRIIAITLLICLLFFMLSIFSYR